MKKVGLILLVLMPCVSFGAGDSPYAGEEQRQIKSLSASEVESLRRGNGMGFAKLAELNHYPGPKHVLEIAAELDLSKAQIDETRSVYEEMRRDAVALGEQLLAAESDLDRQFERGVVTPESLQTAVLKIGELRARLRYVHLEAHLRQQALLNHEQLRQYDSVRGYDARGHDHEQHRAESGT